MVDADRLDSVVSSAGQLASERRPTAMAITSSTQRITWKSNFGLTAGSGAAASNGVPEPSTLLMLIA